MKRKVLSILSVFMVVVVISTMAISVSAEETHKNEFVKANGYTYYYNEYGNLAKACLVCVDDKIYYMDYNGQMQTGWVNVPHGVRSTGSTNLLLNRKKYEGDRYFRSDGTMAYDTTVKFGDSVYGFNEYGKQVIDDFALIKGKQYKFDKNGNKQKATLDSIDEIEKYFNTFYGKIELPNGSFEVTWRLSEGDKRKKPYDYQIYAKVGSDGTSSSRKTRSELSTLLWDLGDTEAYSDKQRDEANKILQDVILKAIRSIIKLDPDAKVEAYYYDMWWDYSDSWRVYTNKSHTYEWLRCCNYEKSDKNAGEYGYTEYKRSTKTKLHWVGSSTPCKAH